MPLDASAEDSGADQPGDGDGALGGQVAGSAVPERSSWPAAVVPARGKGDPGVAGGQVLQQVLVAGRVDQVGGDRRVQAGGWRSRPPAGPGPS